MRRFILTSDKFTGSVELHYREAAGHPSTVLAKADFTPATLTPNQVLKLKEAIPITADTLDLAFTGLPLTIVEADFVVTFDMFWEDYGRKINRKRTLAIWNKMTKTKQVLAWSRIKDYDEFLKREGWRNKQDPDTYLRNETFENQWR